MPKPSTDNSWKDYDGGFQPYSNLEKEILPYLRERFLKKLNHDPDVGKQFSIPQMAEFKGISGPGMHNLINKGLIKKPSGAARGKKSFLSKRDTLYLKHLPRAKDKNARSVEYTLDDLADLLNITSEEAEVLISSEITLEPIEGIDYDKRKNKSLELRIDYEENGKNPVKASTVRINPHDLVDLFNRVFPKNFSYKEKTSNASSNGRSRTTVEEKKGMKEIAPSIDAYFKDIKSSKPLSSEAEAEMARRIRGGDDEATEILAKANLKFVVSVAKEYQGLGLPLNDLISAGNLGLLEAVERFDEERGFRFISYSVWWIRQSILQAVSDQSRNVRLPLNRIGQIQKLKKYSLRKLQEGLSSGEIDAAIINEFDIDEEELNFLRIISQYDTSLDAPVEDDDETRLLQDTLMDESQAPTDEQTMTEDEKRVLHEQLSSLPEGEERVLRLYFGLDNNNPMNLEEIGAYVGRTRERVRQIKEKALGRLRHPAKAGILKPLYEP